MTETAPGAAADGVIDLLGLLAYAQLVAFFRLSEDAAMASAVDDKAALAEMAVAEFGHFQMLRRQLGEMSVDPTTVMRPFVAAVDAFHARTRPADWLEGLVKAYVGDGIAADFYRAVAELLDERTRSVVLGVLADTGHAEFVVSRVRAAITDDPQVAGRLALWARRLVGEALSEAQRVAAEREPLARLLVGGSASQPAGGSASQPAGGSASEPAGGSASQLGEIGRMFARLTDAHARRMAKLGLVD